MPFKTQNEAGEEIDAFTPDEVKAKDDLIAAKEKEAADAKAETEKYKRVASEQTQNFKKLNEMSEEERAGFSARELEARKIAEIAEAKSTALEATMNEDKQRRIQTDKEAALAPFHGGNPELKKALEDNYALINLEGTDIETIQKRAKLAADMEKGKLGGINPLYSPLYGGGPQFKKKTETDEFLQSEKGKKAAKLMGLDEPKK